MTQDNFMGPDRLRMTSGINPALEELKSQQDLKRKLLSNPDFDPMAISLLDDQIEGLRDSLERDGVTLPAPVQSPTAPLVNSSVMREKPIPPTPAAPASDYTPGVWGQKALDLAYGTPSQERINEPVTSSQSFNQDDNKRLLSAEVDAFLNTPDPIIERMIDRINRAPQTETSGYSSWDKMRDRMGPMQNTLIDKMNQQNMDVWEAKYTDFDPIDKVIPAQGIEKYSGPRIPGEIYLTVRAAGGVGPSHSAIEYLSPGGTPEWISANHDWQSDRLIKTRPNDPLKNTKKLRAENRYYDDSPENTFVDQRVLPPSSMSPELYFKYLKTLHGNYQNNLEYEGWGQEIISKDANQYNSNGYPAGLLRIPLSQYVNGHRMVPEEAFIDPKYR